MALTQKQRMLAGELYDAGDPEIQADHAAAVAWMARFNALDLPIDRRHALLAEAARQAAGNELLFRAVHHVTAALDSTTEKPRFIACAMAT